MCIGAISSAASSTNTNSPQRDDRVSAPHALCACASDTCLRPPHPSRTNISVQQRTTAQTK
jgi:hypothetical protein